MQHPGPRVSVVLVTQETRRGFDEFHLGNKLRLCCKKIGGSAIDDSMQGDEEAD
jgi:hypothetical protein